MNAKYIASHIAKGNDKLPKSTYIFNSGSATDCPNRTNGKCQCAESCYALVPEIQYPDVLPYRRRQRDIMSTVEPEAFATSILATSKRARIHKCETFRFNEAGDMKDQADVDWLASVCKILTAYGIVCYGYTASTGLDLTPLIATATVNVSNDDGDWQSKGANRFKAVDEHSKGAIKCAGNCRNCVLCQRLKGAVIEVKIHRPGKASGRH